MNADLLRATVSAALTGLGWFVMGSTILQYSLYTIQTVLAGVEMLRVKFFDLRNENEWLFATKSVPGISLLVPAYNEALTIADNVRSLLTLNYPVFEIIVVNDGSTDATAKILLEAFRLEPVRLRRPHLAPCRTIRGIYRQADYPNLIFIDKENGGKADALNAALNYARNALVCGVDADSLLDPYSLLKAVRPFIEHPNSQVAVGATIRISNGCTVKGGVVVQERAPAQLVPLLQVTEYLRAFLIARVAANRLKTTALISGAFGLFKRTAVLQVGGYTHGTVGEDMELVLKLHRHFLERKEPCRIFFIPDPLCWTEAPNSLAVLWRQRTRWQRGMCEVLWMHRDMMLRPRYRQIGMIALPMFVLADIVGPFLDVLGLIMFPLACAFGLIDFEFTMAYFMLVVFYGIFLSMTALVLGELTVFQTMRKRDALALSLAAIAENFGYRQINLWWRIEGIWQFLRKNREWGIMTRLGHGNQD